MKGESICGLPSFSSYREDMYAQDSIDMLTGAGIQFKRHEEEGVDVNTFAELLMSSGLVLNDEVTWTTFARYMIVVDSYNSFIHLHSQWL